MSRLITASANAQLDEMLEDLCERLQLSETQMKEAEGHYRTIGEWLADEDSAVSFYVPKIRAQGSVPQGTVVKPLKRDEYDIDLICLLSVGPRIQPVPRALYELVATRLEENANYRRMLQRDARCLTLSYAGQFKLDILPGIKDGRGGSGIEIPDREMNTWVHSDPFAFEEWFLERTHERAVMLAEREIEPLPTEQIGSTPLQRAVQLTKRHRDIEYKDRSDRPSSMLLTTLGGSFYEGQRITSDALIAILEGLCSVMEGAPDGRLQVPNPVDQTEDLAAGWSTEERRDFRSFVGNFVTKFRALLDARGIHVVQKGLAELFGEDLARTVIESHAKRFQEARERGQVTVGRTAAGILGLGRTPEGRPIPRNTFFGS